MLKQFLRDTSVQTQPSRTIYQFIYANGPVSRADIIEATQLNRTKVAQLLDELMSKGYIRSSGYGEPTGGRPPTLYEMNPVCSYVVGIQINRIHMRIALFDLSFHKLEEKIFIMTSKHTRHVVMKELIETISNFMENYKIPLDRLIGIGIGTIGPLDSKNGIILNPEPPLAKDWNNVPIVEELKQCFPVDILLENGASAAIFGEYKYLLAPYANLLNVTIGWAWGCGVITDGKLVKVKSGDVSGYGHIVVEADGRPCICGKRGCAASYTTLIGILEEIKERNPRLFDQSNIIIGNTPIDEVMKFLLMKEPTIEEIITDSARYLGIGVANLVNTLHSELVILNGPLIDYYPNYYESVVDSALTYIFAKEQVQLRKGKYESESAVFGAAVQVFESIFNPPN